MRKLEGTYSLESTDPRESEIQRTEINGGSTSMVWPTIGSRTAKKQNRKGVDQSCPWVELTHGLGWVEIFQLLVGWVASPTWSSTEQVARPATKRFHTSDWRPLETCCRPWTWWCNNATALAGYANLMMMMMMMTINQTEPSQSTDSTISSPSLSTFRQRLQRFLFPASFPDIIKQVAVA